MRDTYGFIGLGRMGRGMATNMHRKGFALTVYDVMPHALVPVTQLGAKAATSVADIGEISSLVFTMLPNSPQVHDVAEALAGTMKPGSLVIDMSTIDPAASDQVAALLAEKGIGFVDAPVGRLAEHADRGECLFMVGARPTDFARVKPMLDAMGTTVIHCGDVGTGIRTKIVNNYVTISLCLLNSEALMLMQRFGLDLTTTMDVLNGTTANNGQLNLNLARKVLRDDTVPGFSIDLAHKDLGLAVQSAHELKLPLSVGVAARETFNLARAAGFRTKDFSAVLDHLCQQAGIAPPRLPKG